MITERRNASSEQLAVWRTQFKHTPVKMDEKHREDDRKDHRSLTIRK